MDGAALEALDKAALIELILRLQREVGELRARLGQDSSTSSRPPASDPPGARAKRRAPPPPAGDGRRRGGQPGHPGHHRPAVPDERIDRVVLVRPAACRGCGAALAAEAGSDDPAEERVQVVELPPVRAEVTEYQLTARRCRSCGLITRAPRPAEAGGGAFGPRLQAVATLLVGRYRLSRREAVACLAELGEVALSVGALAKLERATSAALAPVVDEVALAVQQAAVANLDETGWWQGKARAWLWTAVTETLTLFRLDPSRGKAGVQALLGPDWTGIVGSDRYSAYRSLPLDQRQVCWAHLIREFRKIAAYHQHQRPLGARLPGITTRIFAAWSRFRDGAIDRPTLLVELAPLQAEFEDALETGLDPPHAVVAGALCGNLLDSWPARWTFARVDGVEPTNNAAERALRPAVLWRKGSFGTQSADGSLFVERILTAAATCKQQGRSLLDFLVSAVTAARLGLPPPSLASCPPRRLQAELTTSGPLGHRRQNLAPEAVVVLVDLELPPGSLIPEVHHRRERHVSFAEFEFATDRQAQPAAESRSQGLHFRDERRHLLISRAGLELDQDDVTQHANPPVLPG